MTKVLIVEDQRLPRDEMKREITESGRYEPVACISGAELALSVCDRQKVDLILMDVCTNGSMDGIEAAAEIKKKYPDVKIIVVTSMVEIGFIERAKEAGAESFWYKDNSPESLIDIMDATMAGEHCYPERTPAVMIGQVSSDELTPAELKVLRLICEGLEYDEIAEKLCISYNTVKKHAANILAKTGFSSKLRLAIAVTNKTFIIPSKEE